LRRIEIPGETANLWLIDIADEASLPSAAANPLSADEVARANRFVRAQDRTSFILTRAALRHLLGQAVGVPPGELAFSSGAYGKPFLTGSRNIQFNVSHSGSLALVGISAERPIGVDIELMREKVDELALARDFFCEREHRYLATLAGDAQLEAFYKIWTCKEAVLKAFGVGISTYLKDFSVHLTPNGPVVQPEPECFSPQIAKIRVGFLEVPTSYAATFVLA
jgi:4'-phosphopantetheinyl transferase